MNNDFGQRSLVSVVIPTRNRPEMVCRAVLSASQQTHSDLEILVVIDGPDPVTAAALISLREPKLRVITLSQNVGGSEARNTGAREARGEWIAFLDDDDDWYPNKIATQVAAWQNLPNANSFLSCQFEVVTETSTEIHPRRLPELGERVDEYIFCPRGYRLGEGFMQTSTLFVPRELMMNIQFVPGLKRGQEMTWMLSAAAYGKAGFHVVPEVLASFRDNAGDPYRVSAKPQWRSLYDWLRKHPDCLTPKAYTYCIATSVLPDAIRAGASFATRLRLFVDSITQGHLTMKCFYFAARAILVSIYEQIVPKQMRQLRKRMWSSDLPKRRTSGPQQS